MSETQHEVAIVGAGLSGLAMAVELRRAGLPAPVIFEAADEVGGTWRDNTYPGCACDVPSHLYSFSFAPNRRWSRFFGQQPEIFQYIKQTADEHGLRPLIRFNTPIQEARFNDQTKHWEIETRSGERHTARSLILAMGPLSQPGIPDFPGRDRFQGPAFHSQSWDHHTDLAGKRVAVIGTGASAIQIVPAIAPTVGHLDIYQRTPPWIMPRNDRPLAAWERWLFDNLPLAQWLYRSLLYWRREIAAHLFVARPDWARRYAHYAREHITAQIADPALRTAVTPRYTMGCKRVLLSDDYYPALTRDNVSLVTASVAELTEDGVIDTDGVERKADVVIYATGFKATEFLSRFSVYGPGGVELNQAWQSGAEAYYGVTTAGFPNLFFVLGPNSGLGHSSMILMIEAQTRFIRQCLARLQATDGGTIAVKDAAQRAFNRTLQQRMKQTV
ncbi:MAG: NAD(P)/FAD-dependent oxidoreductase, partial [Myxococcota bacterium]